MLNGCAAASLLGGGGPPPATYDLTAPAALDTAGSSSAQLAVTEPMAVGALNSERIVVRTSPTVVTYLKGAQWNDRLPVLVQARLIEAFQNSGRIRGVAPSGGAQASDYGLVTDLRSFEVAAYDKAAVIDVSARIVADASGRVVASKHFRATVALSDAEAPGMTAGLNAAFDEVAGEIVAWTLATI